MPERQNAQRQPGAGNKVTIEIGPSDNTQLLRLDQVLVTAIPAGVRWRLKTVSSYGSISLPPIFSNRLEALGAGVLVANQCGGRVVP